MSKIILPGAFLSLLRFRCSRTSTYAARRFSPLRENLLGIMILAAFLLLPSAVSAAEKSEPFCKHVCAAVCVTSKFAETAKFNCAPKPQHACYKDHGQCAPAANGKCAWKPSDKLMSCVQEKVAEATSAMMKTPLPKMSK